MSDPVFVIHGVANRDRVGFENQVVALARAMNGSVDMRPVYWGDLGADDRWVRRTVPDARINHHSNDQEIRGDAQEYLVETLLAPLAQSEIRDGNERERLAVLTAAALGGFEQRLASGDEIRDGTEPVAAATVSATIAEQWPSTTWLRLVSDWDLLREVGIALTAPLTEPPSGSGEELRGEEIRWDIAAFICRRIADLDRVVGAAFSAAGGRLNAYLRMELIPGITRFFGDVLVYQRRQAEIHDRVRAVIASVDPASGRDREHPVRVVAHSLGGVIAVDMAVARQPLWISSLVTFGSQSPFFHVCDPRGGQLLPFNGETLVRLPESLRRWTNLWEPMDVLAFIAAKVFQLHDGSLPADLPVHHLYSAGMWTHSAYWRLPEVVAALADALS